MSPRPSACLIAISHTLATLTQTVVRGDRINSRAFGGSFGLSVIAHGATWVSRSRFRACLRPRTAAQGGVRAAAARAGGPRHAACAAPRLRDAGAAAAGGNGAVSPGVGDYGNTDIEKRAIFFRLLHRLLDFGRDSERVDLCSLALTHYTLRNLGTRRLALDVAQGDYKLAPSGPGGGEVCDKERAALDEIIARVNQLFVGELTEGDKLLYVNNAIKGKLLECETLIEQAVNNTREQFGNSPDLDARILDAVMDALSAFTSLSRQALESERIRAEIKAILLGPGKLHESLRQRGGA